MNKDFIEQLTLTCSQDNNTRVQAEEWLNNFVKESTEEFIDNSAEIISNQLGTESSAFIVLVLIAHNINIFDLTVIFNICYPILLSNNYSIRLKAISIISQCCVLQINQEEIGILHVLTENINNSSNTTMVDSCMTALALIFVNTKSEFPIGKNEILIIILKSLNKCNDSLLINEVLSIFNDNFEIFFDYFDQDMYIDFIQLLRTKIEIQIHKCVVYKLLIQLFNCDYEATKQMSSDLIEFSLSDLQNNNSDETSHVLWLWINIASVEQKNQDKSNSICLIFSSTLVPCLINLIDSVDFDEIFEAKEWEIPNIARVCLKILSPMCKEIAVPLMFEATRQRKCETSLYIMSILSCIIPEDELKSIISIIIASIDNGVRSSYKRERYAALYCLSKLLKCNFDYDYFSMIKIIEQLLFDVESVANLSVKCLVTLITKINIDFQVEYIIAMIKTIENYPGNLYKCIFDNIYYRILKPNANNVEFKKLLLPHFLVCLQNALQSNPFHIVDYISGCVAYLIFGLKDSFDDIVIQIIEMILDGITNTSQLSVLAIIPNLLIESPLARTHSQQLLNFLSQLCNFVEYDDDLYMICTALSSIFIVCGCDDSANENIEALIPHIVESKSLKLLIPFFEMVESLLLHHVNLNIEYIQSCCSMIDAICNDFDTYASIQQDYIDTWLVNSVNLIIFIDKHLEIQQIFFTLLKLLSLIVSLSNISEDVIIASKDLITHLMNKYKECITQIFQDNYESIDFILQYNNHIE